MRTCRIYGPELVCGLNCDLRFVWPPLHTLLWWNNEPILYSQADNSHERGGICEVHVDGRHSSYNRSGSLHNNKDSKPQMPPFFWYKTHSLCRPYSFTSLALPSHRTPAHLAFFLFPIMATYYPASHSSSSEIREAFLLRLPEERLHSKLSLFIPRTNNNRSQFFRMTLAISQFSQTKHVGLPGSLVYHPTKR